MDRITTIRLVSVLFLFDAFLRYRFGGDFAHEVVSRLIREPATSGSVWMVAFSFALFVVAMAAPRKLWALALAGLVFYGMAALLTIGLLLIGRLPEGELNNVFQAVWVLSMLIACGAVLNMSLKAKHALGNADEHRVLVRHGEPIEHIISEVSSVSMPRRDADGSVFDEMGMGDLQQMVQALHDAGLVDDAHSMQLSIEATTISIDGKTTYVLRNSANGRELRFDDLDAVPEPLRSYFSLGI